jgi:hypothetical protein
MAIITLSVLCLDPAETHRKSTAIQKEALRRLLSSQPMWPTVKVISASMLSSPTQSLERPYATCGIERTLLVFPLLQNRNQLLVPRRTRQA